MSVSLDLRKAFAVHRFGDIIQTLTWVNDERAMVLMPAHRTKAAWYVVCESASYKYDDVHYLARQSRKAAEVLGMGEDTSTWFKIAQIIHDGLPDLIRMPAAPLPEYQSASYGAMTMRADGKPIAQEEIKLEKEAPVYG